MVLLVRVLRYLQRGKTLVVMAVLAPALLTLAMGSLALLRPAVPTVQPLPTATLTAMSSAEVSPTATTRAGGHTTRNPKSPHQRDQQRGGGHNMR